MTIRTRKMTTDAGDALTGNHRIGGVTITADSPIKFYLPYDEGAGAIADNALTGLIFADADANTDVSFGGAANSATFAFSDGANGEDTPNAGIVPSPGSKSFVIWHHATPVAIDSTFNLILGFDATEAYITILGGSSWAIEDDSGNTVLYDPADATPAETYFAAMFVDRTNNKLYGYTSTNNAVLAQEGAIVDISSITDAITLSNKIGVNTVAEGAGGGLDSFGTGLCVFPTSIVPTSADVLAKLESIRKSQLTADKALPSEWLYT